MVLKTLTLALACAISASAALAQSTSTPRCGPKNRAQALQLALDYKTPSAYPLAAAYDLAWRECAGNPNVTQDPYPMPSAADAVSIPFPPDKPAPKE